jgi:hypothetical protein
MSLEDCAHGVTRSVAVQPTADDVSLLLFLPRNWDRSAYIEAEVREAAGAWGIEHITVYRGDEANRRKAEYHYGVTSLPSLCIVAGETVERLTGLIEAGDLEEVLARLLR